ncbi:hypothetical protein B0F90DRAFT_1667162 [Multifurca ochricompacta]|uniref:SUN domain-containing protein n=1 Tax=Multifurca ochricompacta TaxID=376703 RepID=A0AAD4QQ31_9AGAM|nr:hypothetical protein B0F90DRAFT_1667162 [Multifurca ochricompacta]
MSFSGTPLGQGRRLDHHAFLNKHNPSTLQQTQFITRPSTATLAAERSSIPTSYAYGAPTLGTRSPPKPLSAASSRDSSNKAENPSHPPADDSQDDTSLARFSRLKQREQTNVISTNLANINSRTSTTDNPDPTKWALKGTSVQAANAIHQAAMALNPNDSWASSSRTIVPRSTSVEYEKETQSTSTRRLNPPPPRNGPPPSRSATTAAKLAKEQSLKYVPDSQEEDAGDTSHGRQERARTPIESVIELAKRTAFYLRQRSTEPDVGPSEQSQNGHHNNNSYDYEAEEREFRSQSAASKARKASNAAPHKRGRMSIDNKAYLPSQSDLEESDEEFSGDGKRKRRRAKKSMVGPLTTLPIIGQEKRRRRKRGTKADGGDEDEDEEGDDSSSDDRASLQRSIHSSHRHSQPREVQLPPSSASLPRASSVPQPTSFEHVAQVADTTLDSYERGLDSIVEHDEAETIASEIPQWQRSRRAFSAGGLLGRIVNLVLRAFIGLLIFVFRALAVVMNTVGQALGGAFDALFNKPAHWIRRSNPALLLKWLIVAAVLYSALSGLRRTNLAGYIPSLPSQTTHYEAPDVPAANIIEISARLQALENALAGLSIDSGQSRARIDSQARSHSDVTGRLGALESRLQKEGLRVAEDRNADRVVASQGLQSVRHEIETLRSIVTAVQVQQSGREANSGPTSDDEARAKLSSLEERVGSVEGGLREALELGKSSVKTGGAVAGAAWWNKITSSGKKALTIKASDGQDVTELIGHLVDTAMMRLSKDGIAKADFALHSGGASIVPSLTSDTLEIMPKGLRQQIIGYLTGNGFAIGRPPITALHHETHNGHCWPFVGDQGQLGVLLAHPVRIEEVTIDHVERDVAWDMRSAPRQMEVWGFVEGAKNLAKVAAWEVSQNEAGLEIPMQPKSLPYSAKYVRIAQFAYDIDAPNAVQTFPVDEDIRALELDFGLVVLRVLSNWGKEFTCLYRFRVHGEKLEESKDGTAPDAETA